MKKPFRIVSYLVIYEIAMICFSVTLVALSLMDLFWGFSEPYKTYLIIFDWSICAVFAVELLLTLYISKNKLLSLKRSVFTLLMVIPFAFMFKILAVFRITRIFGLIKYSSPTNIGLFTRVWQFFMLPAVIRISKFINLARNYIFKKKDADI